MTTTMSTMTKRTKKNVFMCSLVTANGRSDVDNDDAVDDEKEDKAATMMRMTATMIETATQNDDEGGDGMYTF
jgi:hypothetical protein